MSLRRRMSNPSTELDSKPSVPDSTLSALKEKHQLLIYFLKWDFILKSTTTGSWLREWWSHSQPARVACKLHCFPPWSASALPCPTQQRPCTSEITQVFTQPLPLIQADTLCPSAVSILNLSSAAKRLFEAISKQSCPTFVELLLPSAAWKSQHTTGVLLRPRETDFPPKPYPRDAVLHTCLTHAIVEWLRLEWTSEIICSLNALIKYTGEEIYLRSEKWLKTEQNLFE